MLVQWSDFGNGTCAEIQNLVSTECFPGVVMHCVTRHENIATEWKQLGDQANDPFSCYAWASAWYDAHAPKDAFPVIVIGRTYDNQPLFLLPMILRKIGPFKVLMRPGSKHSAYFGGLFSAECRKLVTKENAGQFWKSVFSTIPDADVIAIDGVAEAELEHGNPMRYLPLLKSGNSSFRMPVAVDWAEQYLKSTNSKARSNDRRCKKRLAELGKLEYRVAANNEERRMMLRSLMAQKSQQFKNQKVPNPFESPSVQAFYEMLIDKYDNQNTDAFFVSALLLDGEPVAVNFGILHHQVLHGLIMTMKQGEFKRYAPGRLLLLETNQYLAEKGIRTHDFGAGEFEYKNTWCEKDITRYNVVASTGIKGRLLVLALGWASRIKGTIKRSDRAKSYVLKITAGLKYSK
jgi:CelD/BcsL family acetyltransferase involved in cellulose biosynthesis